MSLLYWLGSNWELLFWGALILAVFLAARYVFGEKFSLPIALVGSGIMLFLLGRKIERDNYQEIAQDIEEKREKAYEKIDDRNTDRDDVLERLQQGNF